MKEKDAKIANLKAQLSLREAEETEAIRLCSQVYVVEAVEATRVSELNSLKERNIAFEKEKNTLEGHVAALKFVAATKDTEHASLNAQTAKLTQDLSSLQLSCDELSIKAASLEYQKDGLIDQVSSLKTTCSGLRDQVSCYELFKEQCEAIQDEQVKELSDRVAGLEYELMAIALYMDEELYPRFLTTIAGRQWIIGHDFRLSIMKCLQSQEYVVAFGVVIGLAIDKGIQSRLVAGIDHRKYGRGLADVAAYDHSMEARYDASIADIINSLHFEGPSAKTLEKLKKGVISHRTSIYDAMSALVDPLSSENLIGEASTSEVQATAVATTTFSISITAASASSISPILVADYDVLDAGIQGKVPHSPKIVFKKETLETTSKRPTTS
ncbi:hypothetical protein Tco_0955335 [Tanacetum coccineum]|uniref:FRIGIDA-like protein n=1 Tax=Tanacetum coccineum TaxID=301880 RepID=A0ABQ5E6W6_9ASTR